MKDLLYSTFKFSWQDCALASWMKWPNKRRPDVISVDVINKKFDPENGTLTATRLIILHSFLPFWLRKLIGSEVCYFVEESVTDFKNQRLVLKSRNITYANIIEMDEICVYSKSPENPDWTAFEQEAAATGHTFGVAERLEMFALKKFVQNAAQGRSIVLDVIKQRVTPLTTQINSLGS
eukprot:TRINITY_DN17805_c0_g1_i1.p1 TRINITY_DN17805_c0_g1~~TRINITY_DN17805_c0_g1_i1.p1  ORF type:complete len:179 (-),score=20.86 TRINITY_DN17805_c0_g1_i1:18-554(-)